MDVPAAAAGPWIALGAVLGILLLLAVGAVVLRLRGGSGPPAPAARETAPRDDLARFLEHPPGTPGAPGDDVEGWTSLAPAPPADPATPRPDPARSGASPATVLAAFAVAALLLVGVGAALAAARSPEQPAGTGATAAPTETTAAPDPQGADDVAARLFFGGVVLEEHAVGVTAAFPELELDGDDGRAVVSLRLPAVNCLAARAPEAPGDPACTEARTEYADLAGPDLRVVRDGEVLRISGRFDTYLRPPGRPAEPTGRSYEVTVTAAPDGDGGTGWLRAEAELRWDGEVTGLRAEGGSSVVRLGG